MSSFLIAGVDEAGRGCLAGPVIAAAVILGTDCNIFGLTDSKKLTPLRRSFLAQEIKNKSLAFSIGRAEVEEVDQLNILQASLLAMKRAVDSLPLIPEHVLVDGNHLPRWSYSSKAIIGGDLSIAEISAASIIAKTTRDEEMLYWDQVYPGYGFAQHKGYGTKHHYICLQEMGICPIHRRSFNLNSL